MILETKVKGRILIITNLGGRTNNGMETYGIEYLDNNLMRSKMHSVSA